jgi:hypothetical protein
MTCAVCTPLMTCVVCTPLVIRERTIVQSCSRSCCLATCVSHEDAADLLQGHVHIPSHACIECVIKLAVLVRTCVLRHTVYPASSSSSDSLATSAAHTQTCVSILVCITNRLCVICHASYCVTALHVLHILTCILRTLHQNRTCAHKTCTRLHKLPGTCIRSRRRLGASHVPSHAPPFPMRTHPI